ncbi:hypothetical protein PPBDW_I10164 [Photobacterium kishitanii]|nr:hypothetical protein PPBDW_I10164 [Photobacterium kishitanii]
MLALCEPTMMPVNIVQMQAEAQIYMVIGITFSYRTVLKLLTMIVILG